MRGREVRSWLLHGPLAVASLYYVVAFVYVAGSRIGYAFDLEWMEGGALEHVARVLAGQPLYVKPSLQFTPFIYTPLYYWVCAPLAAVFGLGLPVLRAVSVAATLGLFGALYALLRHTTGDRLAGLAAAGVFAATFVVGGAWLDLARVDALFLCFLCAGLFFLVRERDVPAALCFCAAVLTKQSAVFVVAALCGARLLTARGRARVICGGTVVAVLALAFTVLEWRSQGFFHYYAFTLPRLHPLVPHFYAAFWRDDLLRHVPFAVVLALHELLRPRPWRQAVLRWAAAVGFIGTAYASRLHTGGWDNVLMPALLFLAWMSGEAVARARADEQGSRLFVPVLVALQLALLGYDPRPYLPTKADAHAGTLLVARLSAVDGPILIPHHVHLARLAGKATGAHDMALGDVFLGRDPKIVEPLKDRIRRELRSKRYEVIVVARDFWRHEIDPLYQRSATPPVHGSALFPRAGARLRPTTYYELKKPTARELRRAARARAMAAPEP